uniref:Ig-like domain-containing protein n=1 Tax=Oncorhynchus tshawytscha TaxID=74940 RepID=A0A8C8BUP7_ONCTS
MTVYVTANIFLCSLIHGVAGTESSSISQEIGLMSANVGDTVVLVCFNKGEVGVMFSWYKHTFENIPRLISTIYKYDRNATFYQEFKNNPRFSLEGGQGKNNLMIADVELSDLGTYYCGSSYGNNLEFGKGVILIIKGSDSRNMTILQQPVSESLQPGDSVTLNCTIHTETCAGEHSVYWFRHGSGESHPGIIYTHGDRSDQCEKSPEAGSPTQSCVYNLPKRNLSLSDAGTYYCAVASCGEILFGNGTKLDVEGRLHFLILVTSATNSHSQTLRSRNAAHFPAHSPDPNHRNSSHLFTHLHVIIPHYLVQFLATHHCEVLFVLRQTSFGVLVFSRPALLPCLIVFA